MKCDFPEDKKESIVALLLGELSGESAEEIRKHVAECKECSQEARETFEILGLLALSSPLLTPPPELKTSLMKRIKEERYARFSSLPWQVAAALLLVAAIEGYYISKLEHQLNNISDRLAAANLEKQSIKQQMLKYEQQIAAMRSGKLIVMLGKQVKASGRAFWDTKSGNWIFYIEDLPPVPAGKTYQLWFIIDGKPIGSSTFKTDEKGRAELEVKMPVEIEVNKAEKVATAVSLEPEGGSTQPSNEIYLIGGI
ncbi:MAG: anti-sigma factor [Acidobacteriota bacterium]|nr:anti-sigma factor [Blastocatellia bacterium]MDW8413612.1 anti-sigma factor [Acidobacteriota bacterium]